ncbi:hypothetical protein V2I01_22245 [Micromonospora sp. BRA006-A]|nr:hypothetical protein [Micromonospora sp. BRA006-A]
MAVQRPGADVGPAVGDGLVVGEGLTVGDEVGPPVGDVVGPGVVRPSAATSAGYHLSDIFWSPAAFGCTPSYVSVAVLNPVHWSTTTIGEAVVVFPAAQPSMSAWSATVRWPHSGQLAGFIGMIFATSTVVAGLAARIWSTSFEYAARIVAGAMLLTRRWCRSA